MKRDDKGVWSVTIGPLPAGFYTYGYAIDGGLRMPDPSNPNLEVRRWGSTSLFIVPGSGKSVFEERRVPHGTVHVEFYDSPNLDTERMVVRVHSAGVRQEVRNIPCCTCFTEMDRSKLRGSGLGGPT